jgi:hypothetical protein
MPDTYKEGDILQNDQGQKIILRNNQWTPYTQQYGPGMIQMKPGGPVVNAFQQEHPLRAIPPTILQSFGIDPQKVEEAHSTLDAMKSAGGQLADETGEQMFESLAKAGPLAPFYMLGMGIIGVEQGLKQGSQTAYEAYKNRDRYGLTQGLTQVASSLVQLALLKQGKEQGERGMHRGAQFVAGVGSDTVEKLAREHAELSKRIARENAEEFAKAKDIERQKFSEVDAKRAELEKQTNAENQSALAKARDTERQQIDQLEKEHAAAKQEALTKTEASKSAVAERQRLTSEAQKTAEVLGQSLKTAREQETAVAKSLYPDIKGTADAAKVDSDFREATSGALRGSEKQPGTIGRILNELEPEKPKSSARALTTSELRMAKAVTKHPDLATLSDSELRKILPNYGYAPKQIDAILSVARPNVESETSPLNFDKLHGYYTELGKAAYGLEGDERAAALAGQRVIENHMRNLAEADKKSYRFDVAQENYKKLMNTFYNTDSKSGSPIARVLKGTDPITGKVRPEYVQSILSDPKSYAISQRLLSGYKGAGNAQAAMQLMMENMREARRLPSVPKEYPGPGPIEYPKSTSINLKETPTGPEYPKSIPLSPKSSPGTFDPVAARRAILQGQVPSGVTPGLFWRYALLRNLMRKLTNIPMVQDYLSQNPK